MTIAVNFPCTTCRGSTDSATPTGTVNKICTLPPHFQQSIPDTSQVTDIATRLRYLYSVYLVLVSFLSLKSFLPSKIPQGNILVSNCGRVFLSDVRVNLLAVRGFCNGFNLVPSGWVGKALSQLPFGGVGEARLDSLGPPEGVGNGLRCLLHDCWDSDASHHPAMA
jgi:hypothetical protein